MNSLSVSGKNWVLRKYSEENSNFLKDNFSLDEITSKLLSIRQIKKNEISSFLNPSIKNFLPNPYDITDMEKSTLRTAKAIYQKEKLGIFIDVYIKYVEDRFDRFFPKGNDAKVADAILELFRKRENLEIFNKKALYIYIREIMATHGLEVKTPKITKIANKLYGLFKNNYVYYLETGHIDFERP